jgi:hypothetical protein
VPEVVRVSVLCRFIDPNKPAFTRVRAAECVLIQAAKAVEIEGIESRVTELERAGELAKSK